MAECHPVGFQWVMEAKARGATVIHVDPRFTRTSAVADLFVPLRAGTDIAFLGGLVNYVLQHDKFFREYVAAYTNGPVLVSEDFRDTEDLDGLFSGFDPETRSYDTASWQYDGVELTSADPGDDPVADSPGGDDSGDSDSGDSDGEGSGSGSSGGGGEAKGHSYGSGGPSLGAGQPQRDETMQHPRCVLQILKRHFARYTPDMVEQVCGIPPDKFRQVAEAITANSGRDRTTAFVYAVGWTQHTVGAQYIRTASILQTLLGNIGRPGGGILALRGHASIQGSTDIPTLFNILPGYIPMPHAAHHPDLATFIESRVGPQGLLGPHGRLRGEPAEGLLRRRRHR